MPPSPARAIIFDLDGTLVETERLKAQAYAATLQQLLGLDAPDRRAVELYERLVGSTDEMICRAVLEEIHGVADALGRHSAAQPSMRQPRLDSKSDGGPAARGVAPQRRRTSFDRHGMAEAGSANATESSATEPWQLLHELRMHVYRRDFGNESGLTAARYEHNLSLLKRLAGAGMAVAVATSSFTDEADRVLRIVGVRHLLAQLVGREQVVNPKPSPDIYLEACRRLGVTPEDTVTVEDSPLGVTSAQAAGTRWICVPTPFSRRAFSARNDIQQEWVVYDPASLDDVVDRRISGGTRV